MRINPVAAIRGTAMAIVLLAAIAAAVRFEQADVPVVAGPLSEPAEPVTDPFRAELRRCQTLGEAGARDPGCLRAWAENRRRFLEAGRPPEGQPPVHKPISGER